MVVNAVTLESESVLIKWYSVKGGTLSKIEIAQAKELGEKTGWKSNMPLLQWSVTK
jgi:precorrin-6Y C5,15-methyltransferase (decarboxylating)